MTSNDAFDVISVEICLPARRAEDYKPLVSQMQKQFCNRKQPKWILKIYSDTQGYLYEPQYSQEESREMEEEAVAAAEQALPVAQDEEPQRAGGVCSVHLWTHRVPVHLWTQRVPGGEPV